MNMPLVRIELFEGRTDSEKEEMIREVTTAMAASLKIDKDDVDIIIQEIKKKDWATGGVTWDKQ
ncbi:tautomerase family protein [Metabacillus fastidiosus]|uniref:Tautomerase family protein n=2 Tax=Metabacillus fastidiosus TaxID=1458 RepID=A0ABU6P372_9BACI|nr:tautomerase family protein [Metabacillus fastidiosus]MEC2075675.1 tautomerase family protein [Metabacillus fastidiosus]MED4403368.1 tautomerase family protein [Metabacillus fastidiosus]MED4453964.1 tautomerase family protein [Metabacillus fastidiosus]MED4460722.1 tautomerase family protein [Metabacillus fastidiosus]MED4534692.1 tautomerase family protein [Metabacillus fastidiosus]